MARKKNDYLKSERYPSIRGYLVDQYILHYNKRVREADKTIRTGCVFRMEEYVF